MLISYTPFPCGNVAGVHATSSPPGRPGCMSRVVEDAPSRPTTPAYSCSCSCACACSFDTLRRLPVPSRILASTPVRCLLPLALWMMESAARPFAQEPALRRSELMAARAQYHVNPSKVTIAVLRRPRSLNTMGDSTCLITGSGLANDSRSCPFSTRSTRPPLQRGLASISPHPCS